MSHFTWLASFDADCPLCGAHMAANVQHECFPDSAFNTPNPTLGKALAAHLQERPKVSDQGEQPGTVSHPKA